MTDEQIRTFFDSRPNMTMAELSQITHKSIPELKAILMPNF
jgi:hypothetical protein